MAKRRNTGSGYTPPSEPGLIYTDPPRAIGILEDQASKIRVLDPNNEAAVLDADGYLHADVKKVFGAESDEYLHFWPNHILEPRVFSLGRDDYDDFGGFGSATRRAVMAKAGIEEMVLRMPRLIERAKELAAQHRGKENKVSFQDLIDDMGTSFTLVKPNGDRIPYRGARDTAKGRITVLDPDFAGEVNDTIEFAQPNGKSEVCDVTEVSHAGAGDFAHYTIKLRSIHARPKPPAPSIVDKSTHYSIHGSTVGAVGDNATVASSHVTGKAVQWNGGDQKVIADELAKFRKELAPAAAGDGPDAEQAGEDLAHVSAASKALAKGDEHGFVAAMKLIGAKGWALVDKLAVPVTMALLQAHGYAPALPHG